MFLDKKHLDSLFDFSAQQLNDAYGRMNMENQKWAGQTIHEIEFILNATNLTKISSVLDLGCGIGRHSLELARRGMIVRSVDPSERLISVAMKNVLSELSFNQLDNITFCPIDGRKSQLIDGQYDLVICLYDVIGSYRNNEDNLALLNTIVHKLKKGGRAVVSIMNMELTRVVAKNIHNIHHEPHQLLHLKPSNIMQQTGDVFKPDYFILDEEAHLVFRKEQFEQDGYLSAEYVIADYRFTLEEFCEECKNRNLTVIDSRYVQLGHWDIPLSSTHSKAKEILFTLEKNCELYNYKQNHRNLQINFRSARHLVAVTLG